MSLSQAAIDRLPSVEGTLYFMTPMAEKPHNLASDPPADVPRTDRIPEAHTIKIHDLRPIADRLWLDREAIGFVEPRTAQRDFHDEDDGTARFAPHSSFEDPMAPADLLPRESIELGLPVFHGT